MYKKIILFMIPFCMYGCIENRRQESAVRESVVSKMDALAPLYTLVSKLPDSLQPVKVALSQMPAPVTQMVPGKGGAFFYKINEEGKPELIPQTAPFHKPLPYLYNQKGDLIRDSSGNPILMGEGGISNMVTITTDNGLALESISPGHNSAMCDHLGNLWFGTYGGGVSCYNGISFTNFNTEHGLADDVVLCILEDRSGNIWFGTHGGGLSRFDRRGKFTTYDTSQGLPDNGVYSMIQDRGGNLWLGTAKGISKFDGHSFNNFSNDNGPGTSLITAIFQDQQGKIWFGTNGSGVFCYTEKEGLGNFEKFSTAQGLANNFVWCINQDKRGNIWMGTEGGVSRMDKKQEPNTGYKSESGAVFTNFGMQHGLGGNEIRCITEDRDGNVWMGSRGGGVSRFNYQSSSFVTYTTAQGLANNIVFSITEDQSGNLWFGTSGGGVSRYEGRAFNRFTTEQGLSNSIVFSIFQDSKGNYWFGNDGGGVTRYNSNIFNTREAGFTHYTTAQGLTHNRVISIAEDRFGYLWFGTEGGGVSKFDGLVRTDGKESFTHYTTAQGLANNTVWSILEDITGKMWFATYEGGISSFSSESGFVNYTTRQGLAHDAVWCIDEDSIGNLWFGTYGGGVSCFNGNSVADSLAGFINFSVRNGLGSDIVFCITHDRDHNLWFATNEGLSVLPVKKWRDLFASSDLKVFRQKLANPELFTTFSKKNGLPDNVVTQVQQLPDGKMAIGTNLGITIFNYSVKENSISEIEVFNSETGYPVKDVNVGQNCLFADRNGILWAGTGSEKSALVRFDYHALIKHTLPPKVQINRIKVNEQNVCWNNLIASADVPAEGNPDGETLSAKVTEEMMLLGRELNETERDSMRIQYRNIRFDSLQDFSYIPQNLELPFSQNHITFEFAAIETGKPNRVQYQYQLLGYDNDWSPVLRQTSASFGNIGEGDYTFKVKALGPNGVWSQPVLFSFKVQPPWYRTWWAYLFYIGSATTLLILIFRWRTAKLRRDKEKLEQTVTDRTAEVVAEKKKSDDLLLNILPGEVAEELKVKGSADAKMFEDVTVMFTDFKGFTKISEKLTPAEVVAEIHYCFKEFDRIITKHHIEKIKTIGDAYMCAGGLPQPNRTHACDVVTAAMEIQEFMEQHLLQRKEENKEIFEIRIGVHTGPVVAGIVGVKKFAYDIWGDTVNTASRMESSGQAGKINISGSTYNIIQSQFICKYRGKIEAKGKGEVDMYFVEGKKESSEK